MPESLLTGQQETTEPTDGSQAVDGGEGATPAPEGKGDESTTDTAAAPEDGTKPTETQEEGDDKSKADEGDKGEEKPKDGEGKGEGDVPESYDLKLSEGSLLDEAALENISTAAKELGLTNDQAQKMVEAQEESVNGFLKATQDKWAQRLDEWVDNVKADKEIGGDNYETSMKHARAAMDKFATDEFKAALNESGYGNHPELVRVMARIGKVMAEDTPVSGDNARGGKKSHAELLYGD